MGRHRTQDEKRELGERARALRAAGRSRREIEAELGIGDDLAKAFLRGVPLPERLTRSNAKDDLRMLARQMRAAGLSYSDIVADLGVSKSSLSLWLRDQPAQPLLLPFEEEGPRQPAAQLALEGVSPEPITTRREAARTLRGEGRLLKEIAGELEISIKTASIYTSGMPWPARARHGGDAQHVRAMAEARWRPHRRKRDTAAQQRKLEAANAVGMLDDSTVLLLGAVAYWCEGTKSKPWRRQSSFVFINSDPVLMRLFVRWLRLVEVPPERWLARIQIHETGDLAAAERWWRHILGVEDLAFGKTVIKRHKPLTRRKNMGTDYHGCLSIYVRKGSELLQQVEGWTIGALLGAGGALPARPMPWSEVQDWSKANIGP